MLSSLPHGIFEGLTALTTLRLGRNLVDPMPLMVSLQQVTAGQFKVVISEGAPFDITIPVNGSTVTISKGSIASATFTSTTNVSIGALPSLPANHFGYVLAQSAMYVTAHPKVAEAIAAAVPNVTGCNNVTEVDLARITSLNLSSMSITSLASDDLAGLLSLVTLDLSNNQLNSLPAGIFDGLTTLTTVNLSGNSVSPLPLSVSLQKVGSDQIKAVVPTGAPFDIVLPISVANGSLSSGTTLTIPTGSVESSTQTITHTSGTTAAVTVDISSLPNLPSLHNGYGLVKSNQQPLEIFSEINVAPVFTEGTTATRTIAENTAADTNMGTAIVATDANNDTLTYSLSGTDAASFSIVRTSGQLQTKSALDYEEKTSYSVTITVSDGSLTDTISVTINVTDVDENRAPVFTEGNSTSRSIAENTGSGVDIGSAVSATDADDDTLTYTLNGTDAASFSINSTSGQLRTKSALDYETQTSYSVTISVSDGSLTDTISVTINITDVDETPAVTTKDNEKPNKYQPVFTEGDSTTRTVAENTSSGVDIGSAVSAADEDKDDTLTYSLGGTDASSFSIDSTSGQLRTSAALDYETKDSYFVTITVSDDNGGSDTISVTINITDVDESAPNNAPTFDDGDSATRTVAENTSSGVDIGSAVSATDTDKDTLTYSLSGTNASSFSIDSSSGQLRTSASLDYESTTSYSVTVSVSDGKGGSDSISVTINVTNLDETTPNHAPVFATDSTTRSIAENTAADTNIGGTITATDADSDTLTYVLSGTNASDFSIVNTSGQLKTKSALNHESKSSYSVTITASDGKGGSDSISVTISVTDVNEVPIFADGTTTTRAIAENVGENINIGKAVSASDPDDGAKLEYKLEGTNAESFNIEGTTGQLKTKVTLDFETKPSYSVIVKVSDGNLTESIAVTINVTDLNETPTNIAPVFDEGESTSRSVAENTDANQYIGDPVSASDEDSNILAYLLSGDDASSFSIDSSTGQLKTSAALDHEDEDSYEVTVTVNDGSTTDMITVTINVTDVNEAPIFADDSTILSVAENTATNTNIGSAITATDPDDDDLTYSLEGTDAPSFDIVRTTGQLKTKAALDYEDETSYSVILKASDDNLTDTISITINVTDVDENSAPAFASESTTRAVAENTGPGVNIGDAVSATDADTLTYTLSGIDAVSFDINSTNGQLRTKAALDYENKSSYSVIITASDSKKNDTINVTINVTDVNENRAPSFGSASTTRSIAENTDSGTNVGAAVYATDADKDTLTYTLSGTDASSFSIVGTTGQLQTKAELDYETKRSYSVTVTATDDSGASNNSATITVTISVTDVNENRAPSFGSASTTRSVAENTASGQNIGAVVSATDADEDTLTYTLSGTDTSSFSIVGTTGQLQTRTALDYETKSSYSVTVTAMDDSGASNNSASITVTITVTDVDENRAPTFTGSSISFSISDIASASVGDSIGFPITATDADNDTLSYSVDGDDASYFSIDSSGQLKVTQALIDGTSSSYSIKVIATDPDNATAEISVMITVTRLVTQPQNINTAPAFDDGASTTRSIAENTASGQNIGAPVSATDRDTDDTLTYTLEGTDASSFSIVSTSGQLQTSAALDYETTRSYSVTVKATDDSGATNNSATITVTINVTNISDTTITLVSDRTQQVQDAIVAAIDGVDSATDVTAEHLASITEISLYSKLITSLKSGDFDGLIALTNLSLVSNYLTTLPSGVFDGLTALERLDLRANYLDTLPSGVFDGLTTLEFLGLDDNYLAELPSDIFDELTALIGLDLDNNDFSTLPSGIFDELTTLSELFLNNNNFAALSSDIFDELTALKRLELGFNDFSTLPSGIFDELTALTNLFLDNNDFTTLSSDIFDELTALRYLYLGHNDFTTLPSDIFDELTALRYLSLLNNGLTSLPSGIELPTLYTIRLENNDLPTLPSGIFDELPKLSSIYLGNNDLTTLPSGIFDELPTLSSIYLENI